jgi:hypothetical protein
MYITPRWEEMLYYKEAVLEHTGTIPASYGTDLIQVSLDADLEGASLEVAFQSKGARYHVEAWKLHMDEAGPRNPARGLTGLHAVTPQPEALPGNCSAECTYIISGLDPAKVDRLMLIVVRLDPHEEEDPRGSYELTVGPAR